jgi:hypothetical protein
LEFFKAKVRMWSLSFIFYSFCLSSLSFLSWWILGFITLLKFISFPLLIGFFKLIYKTSFSCTKNNFLLNCLSIYTLFSFVLSVLLILALCNQYCCRVPQYWFLDLIDYFFLFKVTVYCDWSLSPNPHFLLLFIFSDCHWWFGSG